jgi:hypothetical protein
MVLQTLSNHLSTKGEHAARVAMQQQQQQQQASSSTLLADIQPRTQVAPTTCVVAIQPQQRQHQYHQEEQGCQQQPQHLHLHVQLAECIHPRPCDAVCRQASAAYPTHVRLHPVQKGAVALLSAVGALVK